MITMNLINEEVSGFYDNGGEYVINLKFKNEVDLKEFKKLININIKNKIFKKEYNYEDLRVVLKTNNLPICFRFLKQYNLKLYLETL